MTPLTVAQLPTKLLLRPDCLEVWYGISVDPANPGDGENEWFLVSFSTNK